LDVCVYQGGFGSGKTFAGSLLGILLALKFPKILGLVGAQTYSLVRDTTLVSYFEHLENMGLKEAKDFDFSKSEQKLFFKNGSIIMFRHFDEPSKLKSLNLGFAEIEEMSDVPYETFKMLLGRMRQIPGNSWKGFRYRIFGHTNPEARRGWIYNTFVRNKKPNYRLIIAPTTENVYLPKHYCEELKYAYDEKYYKKNVLGEFEEDSSAHVVKDFTSENIRKIKYDKDLPLHISCDFNVDPMCWVLAYKDDRKIYAFDEIALENATTAMACAEFHRRYGAHKGPIIINGDASGDNRTTASEYTNYVIMKNRLSALGYYDVRVEIRAFNPPIKNRINAFNAMVHSAAGERRLLIDPKCEKVLYNINNLKYREGSSILNLPSYYQIKQTPEVKFLGHPFDAISYIAEFYFPIHLER
jgi:PBSX family phage terminase large subunit